MRNISRTYILAMLALTAPAVARAQVSLGIKGGISFGTLSNKEPDWKSRTGFAAGLALDMRAKVIGIQPELLYVQKGVEFDGSPSASSDAPQLSYLEVPLLVKVTIPTPGIHPMIYAGPSVMFRLTCSFAGIDCKDAVKSVDYGAVLGGGLRFGGDHGFTVEGRYNWGLNDINDPGAGVKQQTRTFLLLAGISF